MTRVDWLWGVAALVTTIFGLAALWINPTNPALVLMALAGLAWVIYHADALDELIEGNRKDSE